MLVSHQISSEPYMLIRSCGCLPKFDRNSIYGNSLSAPASPRHLRQLGKGFPQAAAQLARVVSAVGDEPGLEAGGRHGPGEEIALGAVALQLAQECVLLRGLD